MPNEGFALVQDVSKSGPKCVISISISNNLCIIIKSNRSFQITSELRSRSQVQSWF